MKQKFADFIRIINTVILLSALLFGINSCSSKYPVSVLNKGNDSFAALKISNPYGPTISFSGGTETPAIGYELNGDTVWLKGQPEISTDQNAITTYNWKSVNGKVILQVKNGDKDKDFVFTLECST